jgi:hypothetical protein
MSPRQLRIRSTARFAVLTLIVGLWYFLAHAIPALLVMAVGL